MIIDVDNNNFHETKKTSGASSPPLMASSTACSTELPDPQKARYAAGFFHALKEVHMVVGTPMTENPTVTSSLMNQSSLSSNVWEW